MQGFRHSLRPLQLFGGVIEEKSLLAEVELLETTEWDKKKKRVLLHFFLKDSYVKLSWYFIVFLKQVSLLNGRAVEAFRMSGLRALNVWVAMFSCSERDECCQKFLQYVPVCVTGLWEGLLSLRRVERNRTHPTQYMSGGRSVHWSHGLRLSLGVCPLTL